MENQGITHYFTDHNQVVLSEFEEAIHHTMLQFGLRHLAWSEVTSEETLLAALQKAIQVCSLAGINGRHHFKKVFVFDPATGTLYPDWMMSKEGFNLMIMQLQSLNTPVARWLWELSAK